MTEELVEAAFGGDVDEVGRLLDAGARVDADGRNWNPLHAAIENEHVACVRLLLARGADVEHRVRGDLSPLAHAVDIAVDGTRQSGGSPGDEPVELINILLAAGADPNSALGIAQEYESRKIVDLLTTAASRR